jgi:hypothetical protein
MKSKSLLFVVLSILLIAFTHGCGRIAAVPDELVGTWKTTDLKYKDTFFELTKEKIIFRTLKGDLNASTIKRIKVKKVPDTEETLYRIIYVDLEGMEAQFSIYFNPRNSGEIRLQNQPEITWIKEKD